VPNQRSGEELAALHDRGVGAGASRRQPRFTAAKADDVVRAAQLANHRPNGHPHHERHRTNRRQLRDSVAMSLEARTPAEGERDGVTFAGLEMPT
jgi:hypothetical protein